MPDNLYALIAIIVVGCWFLGIIVYCLVRKFGKAKTVKAKVVHKQTAEVFSRYSGSGKSTKYYVTFQIAGKRKTFSVQDFSYKGYRVGESGTLKYKLGRIIDFH